MCKFMAKPCYFLVLFVLPEYFHRNGILSMIYLFRKHPIIACVHREVSIYFLLFQFDFKHDDKRSKLVNFKKHMLCYQ